MAAHSEYYTDTTYNNKKRKVKEQLNSIQKKVLH